MLTASELSEALASLPVQAESGVAYRIIHAKYATSALSSIGSIKFGGRYNSPQAFEALYLASNPIGRAVGKCGTARLKHCVVNLE